MQKVQTGTVSKMRYWLGTAPTAEFVSSLDRHGQRVPILVTKELDFWRVIDGRRRCEALRILHGADATVRFIEEEGDEDMGPVIALITQFHRSANPLGEARSFDELRQRGMSNVEIGKLVGVSEGKVRQRLLLLDSLVPELQAHVEAGTMPPSAIREAVKLSAGEQEELAVQDRVTIKQVAAKVREEKIAALDLSGLDVPLVPQYGFYAARLVAIAQGLDDEDKAALLRAAQILEGLAEAGFSKKGGS